MNKFKLLLSVIAMMLLGSTAIMAQESKGYALFGTVPEGYEDLTGNVEVSTNITQSSNNITATDYTTPASITFTGKGFHGKYVCHTNVAVAVRFKNDQLLTMTDQMAIHVKMKRTDDKTEGALELSMCKKAWGGEDGRLSFEIPNTDVTTTESEVVLEYTNYSTKGDNLSTYRPEYFLGEQKYFGGANNELFRVCAAIGEQFEITQIYIEAPHTLPLTEIPDQAPQRIYLRKGTAATPADVAETADYTATTSVSSVHWNCIPSETFFGITTLVREWWLNFQLKSSADVDLTPVYSTWNLVFRVKNGVVNEGEDRGLRVQVNGQTMNTVTTYADANSFVTYVLPLKDVIFGTNNLGNIATGGTIIDFSSGFDNNAGQTIEFDYIYLTNETEPIPANVTATATATAWNKVELSLFAECATSTKVTYDVTYNGTTKTFTGNAGAITTCVIDGLEGSTAYTFSVVAKNSAGEAAPVTANATTPAEPEVIGYAIFGEVPTGYVDLTGKIKIPDGVVTDGIISLSGTSHSSHICQDASKSLVLKVASESINMNLTDQFAIHVKIKKTAGVTNDVHVSFTKNDWNQCRAGFRMNATNIPEDAFKDMVIRYDSKIANGGGQYYCDKPEQLCGNQTWNANCDFLRFAAASGEILYISQIYIEKTYTPEPAPTIVTATATATEWDKVKLNLQANCEKSMVVTYEVTYGSNTKTFTGNAGETTTYVIDGLQAKKEYTFSVVAKNEDGVAATAEIKATTPAKPATAEVRYYFYRTGDLPANSAELLNIDMRDGKGSTISTSQASKVAEETTFSKYLMSKTWGFVQVKAKESSLEDVTGDWYLCVRYKSTHPGDVYVNVAASDKSMLLLAEKENNDNLWKTKKVKLSDFLNPSYSFPVAANSDLFQFETNDNNASERGYLTVDYAYLTNNENSEDLGYQDVTAPVMNVNQTDLTATSVSFNIAGIDDSDSKIYYTISDGTNNYEFTYNSKEAFDYQLTGLEKGTDYTITITAKDPFGNQSTWSQAITTIGDATAPEMVSVNKGEVLDNSIELLLKANDNQEGTLTYTISVGGNTYTTTGLAGEEVSYKVTGLTPETEYEFSVVATDAGENTSAPIVVKYSTTAFVAYRYYIVGEGDASNPNHIAVACNTEYSNSTCYQDERILDYYSIKANTTWMAVNFKPVETKPNTINNVDADNWYIVMRMRSSMDNNIFGWNRFRVNLVNNGQNFYLNTSDWFGVTSLGDGQWHTVKFKLSAAAHTVPSQFLQKDQIAVQLHVNDQLQKDEFFDIDYLYFTNEVVEDNGTQDGYKFLLRDTKDNTALLNTYNAQTVDVDLNRSFVADGAWYTLCLPFSMTADQVNAAFGACKLAKLNGSELRGSSLIHLNFDYVNTIEAGVPYLFMPMADVKPVIIEDVVIDNTLRPIVTDYFSMNGIFSPTQVATGDYFLGSDNYLYPVQESDNSSLKGLRAYFTIGAGAPANAQARVVMAPTVATDLQENTITTTAEKVIKDGTIYILRGDKIYTTTGQLVK